MNILMKKSKKIIKINYNLILKRFMWKYVGERLIRPSISEIQRLAQEAELAAEAAKTAATQANAAAASAGASMQEAKVFSETVASQAESIQKTSGELSNAAGQTSSTVLQKAGLTAGILGFLGAAILGIDAWQTPDGAVLTIDKASMRYRYNSYSETTVGQKKLLRIAHYRGNNDLSDLNFTGSNTKLADPTKVETEIIKIDIHITKLRKSLVNQEIMKAAKQLNMPHHLNYAVLDAVKHLKK
jgi:hypothetical protein